MDTWAKHTPVKVKTRDARSDSVGNEKESLHKSKSFLGFDISQENNELVADDQTDPFPEGKNAKMVPLQPKKKEVEKKPDASFGVLMKRPSSLPEAPNFVEHLDALLDGGKLTTKIVDNGKPKMWL